MWSTTRISFPSKPVSTRLTANATKPGRHSARKTKNTHPEMQPQTEQGVGTVFAFVERTDTRWGAARLRGRFGCRRTRGLRRESVFCRVRSSIVALADTPLHDREQAPGDTKRWRDGSGACTAPPRLLLLANAAGTRPRTTRYGHRAASRPHAAAKPSARPRARPTDRRRWGDLNP